MAYLRKTIFPIIETKCLVWGRPRNFHLTSFTRAKLSLRKSPRVSLVGQRSDTIRFQKTYDPDDSLPPVGLLNSAQKSGALDLKPEAVLKFLRQYLSFPDKKASSWERRLCNDHEITPQHLLILSKILGRCETKAQRSLAKQLMLLSASLGSPSATFEITQQALRTGTLSDFKDTLYQLGTLAKNGDPQAMSLLGNVLLAQNREPEAMDWFRKATRAPTGNTEFPGAGEALMNEGRVLMRSGETEAAESVLRKAALQLDEPFAYFYLSQLQSPGSSQQERYLKKAASSGVAEAAHNLGALELAKVDVDVDVGADLAGAGDGKVSKKRDGNAKSAYAMAIEWFSVAAQHGLGLSMLNLALIYKATGDIEAGLAWLEKAEAVPDISEQAKAVRESW